MTIKLSIRQQGYNAFYAGKHETNDNPYPTIPEAILWSSGWHQARQHHEDKWRQRDGDHV